MQRNLHLIKNLTKGVKPLMALCFIVLFSKANSVFAQSWDQIIKTVASDRKAESEFGYSVAISGDYAVVGAIYDYHVTASLDTLKEAGAAYIFKNNAGTWSEVQKIVASNRSAASQFGCSVAISGDYVIVGAFGDDLDATEANFLDLAGSAYIFKNTAGIWSQVQKIVASDRAEVDFFGTSVAISGDYAIVGANLEDENAVGGDFLNNAGSAYIFKNNAGVWSQVQKIVASDRGSGDGFGTSVSLSGDQLIVGAYTDGKDATGFGDVALAGSAYIFKNNAGTWSQVQKIVASDRSSFDYFGFSVAISGDYAVIGARYDAQDVKGGNPISTAGSAYIFKNNGGSWSQVQKIVASDRETSNQFGQCVAISGDYILVGAFLESEDEYDANTMNYAGSVYVFKNNSGIWSELQKIVAKDRAANDRFGFSMAISEDYAIIGANLGDKNATGGDSIRNSGSAYFFKKNAFGSNVKNSFGSLLKLYPNPTNGNFLIDLGAKCEDAKISITTLSGKLIELISVNQSQVIQLSINEPAGVYFVSIQTADHRAVIRLLKE